MIEARQTIIGDLRGMNQRVIAGLDEKDLAFTIEQAAAVQNAIHETTAGTLRVIDNNAQIFPPGNNLGSTPFFNEDELVMAYIESVNS